MGEGNLGSVAIKGQIVDVPTGSTVVVIYNRRRLVSGVGVKVHDVCGAWLCEGKWIYHGILPPVYPHVLRRQVIFLGGPAVKGGGYMPWQAFSAHVLRRCMIFLSQSTVKGGWIYHTPPSPCAQKAGDIPQPICCEGGWIYALAGTLGPCTQKACDIPRPTCCEGGWIYALAGTLSPCAQKVRDIPRAELL